jgi:hypothetical protein
LVCENGYIGKDSQGRQHYAISGKGHNGSGWWPIGTEDRFEKLGIELRPWISKEGGHVLICGQRGIGTPLMASPPNWHNAAAAAVKLAKLPAKIRLHPGMKPAATTLEFDLSDAKACAIWSSSSGVKALALGYPVFYAAPFWICEDAAMKLASIAAGPMMDDQRRLEAFRKMAWAQWSVEEIESGTPFIYFLGAIKLAIVRAAS